MSSSQSCGTYNRNAAVPPVSDQSTGTISRIYGNLRANRNNPSLKIVTGQDVMPNVAMAG